MSSEGCVHAHKKHLVNKNDAYFSREMVKETRKALPKYAEIGKMSHEWNLAVKCS